MNLAGSIEHTYLRADATSARIERLCAEALEHHLVGVCVPPLHVSRARERGRGSRLRIITVIGFPLGAHTSRVKAEEARVALDDGAHELDMVMSLGLALDGNWEAVARDIRAVRQAAVGAKLKVILETGALDPVEVRKAAEVAIAEGADFLKTSTGFGPRGATVEDVLLLSEVSAGRVGIKAAGGIRTRDHAEKLVLAGASRIGTSDGPELVRI